MYFSSELISGEARSLSRLRTHGVSITPWSCRMSAVFPRLHSASRVVAISTQLATRQPALTSRVPWGKMRPGPTGIGQVVNLWGWCLSLGSNPRGCQCGQVPERKEPMSPSTAIPGDPRRRGVAALLVPVPENSSDVDRLVSCISTNRSTSDRLIPALLNAELELLTQERRGQELH